MASKVLVPAAPFAKLKVQKSPQEPLPLQPQPQGFVIGTEATARVAHLEHSVRFLQEQHRLMLSGLHAEIEALRERNRDLQFQLIFNKESATKNSSPNTEDKENTVSAAENSEVESLKAEVGKLKREAAAARGEARVAEARALQLQRVVDLQAEKLRESEAQRGACSDERVGCEGLDETRSELRARLADAERLVRRLRADAERQRREVHDAAATATAADGPSGGVTNLLFDGAHAQHAHLACMKNTLQASLRASGCGMEFGYQNYHFPALMPEYWREREHALRDEPPAGHGQPRGVRGTRRVLTLPELAGQAVPRATVYANHHTQPLQPRVNGYDKPKKSDMQHPNESTVSVPAETAPPRPRPRRHHRKHADHT